ncbi:MAG: glycosyltransferase [Parachlamydiales bacterium]|jgi:glycosyltransferase involved in cell wall biosynthesis
MQDVPRISLELPRLDTLSPPALGEISLTTTYHDYEFPTVSVVIPTYNCAQSILQTIESVLNQTYPTVEIIVIDGGSTDKTIELIKGFQSDKIQIYSVSIHQRYEMLNKGISQTGGEYISCLFPGDYFVSQYTYRTMMEEVLEHDRPHMIYCGTLIRETKKDVRTILRPFSIKFLKEGLQPTSLQACWFRTDLFSTIGKFDTTYSQRGGFELMCRIINQKSLRTVEVKRVYTDSETRNYTRQNIFIHFWESARAIRHHFGVASLLSWLLIQKDTKRLMQMWVRSIKLAIFGK